MSYPEKMIRGLSNQDTIEEDGTVLAAAFQFKQVADREELSINWYDNDEALDIAMNQRKVADGSFQFQEGVAILSKNKVDDIKFLNYERAELEGNPYHGNIFYKGITKGKKKLLAGMLSMTVVEVKRRIQYNK